MKVFFSFLLGKGWEREKMMLSTATPSVVAAFAAHSTAVSPVLEAKRPSLVGHLARE